jgi:hypothetical protein
MLESLKELLHRQPFQPFQIVTASGDKYEVENPDLIAVGASQINYFFPRSDRWVFIRLNQITALESGTRAA